MNANKSFFFRCCLLSIAFIGLSVGLIWCDAPAYKFMPDACVGGIQISLIIVALLSLLNMTYYKTKCCLTNTEQSIYSSIP